MSRYRSQIKEVMNRNIVVTLALQQGFNAFIPVYDGGVDFVLYRESDNDLRKVQLKSRWMIDEKYRNRDVWMAFPVDEDWYLVPHDKMFQFAERESGVLQSRSWTEGGAYSWPKPSKAMMNFCAEYRFASIAAVAASAANDAPA